MRSSVTDFIDFFVDRIVLLRSGTLRVKLAYSLAIYFGLGSNKVYHAGTF
jgi:hypothetical protein